MDTRALTVVTALAATAAVATLLVRGRGHRIRLPDLAVAFGVFAGLLLLTMVPIVALAEFSPAFDIAHLLYLGAVVGVPMLGVGALALGLRRGISGAVGTVCAAGILLAPIGWYGTHVAPYRLEQVTATQTLPAARAGSDHIRVGVLADLQATRITSYEHQAVTELLALSPDVIVVPGDLFQGSEEQFAEAEDDFRALLGRLDAPAGSTPSAAMSTPRIAWIG